MLEKEPVVLPDGILGSPGLGYVREWILQNTRVLASIDLHPDAFQPKNSTQTSCDPQKRRSRIDGQAAMGVEVLRTRVPPRWRFCTLSLPGYRRNNVLENERVVPREKLVPYIRKN